MKWYFAALTLPFVPLLILIWLNVRYVSWVTVTLTACAAISAYCMSNLLEAVTE